MILDTSAAEQAKNLIKGTKPTAENVNLYKQLGLEPKDFKMGFFKTWTDWLQAHGGPEYTGVTLTGDEVRRIRGSLAYLSGWSAPKTASTLMPSSREVLKKLGIQPSDLGLSGTWT